MPYFQNNANLSKILVQHFLWFLEFFLCHDWCLAHRSEDFDECFKLIVCFDQNSERVWLQFDAVTNVLIVKTKGHLCEYF